MEVPRHEEHYKKLNNNLFIVFICILGIFIMSDRFATEEKLDTAPFDPRFPNQNQTR